MFERFENLISESHGAKLFPYLLYGIHLWRVGWNIPTFYLNSIFSQPVYEAGKPTGIFYRTNFFSSYVNPLGLALTEKWQWLLYLLIRLGLASALIALLLLAASLRKRASR